MRSAICFAILLPSLLTACQSLPESPDIAAFNTTVSWEGTQSCLDPNSPRFTVSQVPAGTDKLVFLMEDLDKLSFRHGGGEVRYNGESTIPYGAFQYKGPCPPGVTHTYRWTIKAIDSQRQMVVGKSVVERKFPE